MNELSTKTRSLIRSALRRIWSYSAERSAALTAAKRFNSKYECKECKDHFARADVQVDHVTPIGAFTNWQEFIDKLFCDASNLRVLCKPCHLVKTREEAGSRAKLKKEKK